MDAKKVGGKFWNLSPLFRGFIFVNNEEYNNIFRFFFLSLIDLFPNIQKIVIEFHSINSNYYIKKKRVF